MKLLIYTCYFKNSLWSVCADRGGGGRFGGALGLGGGGLLGRTGEG